MYDQIDNYLDHIQNERGLSSHTLEAYASDIRHFLQWLETRDDAETIADLDIRRARAYLAALQKEKASPATVARRLASLRSFCRYLKQRGELSTNIFLLLETPRKEKKIPEYLQKEELDALFNAPDTAKPLGMRDRAILELLYATGIRVSELASLNVTDIELSSDDEIRVLGKRRKERIVIIAGQSKQWIERYVREGLPRLAGETEETPALFLNRKGGRLTVRSIQRLLKKYIHKAAIAKNITPHSLRHTFATHMLHSGADLRSVQELLGHASVSSTQIYTHIPGRELKSIHDKAHPRAQSEEPRGKT